MRVIQISDCHLPQNPKTLFRGESAEAGLQSLVGPITEWRPHVLLATGDLSEDASEASYQRLKQYFKGLAAPILVVPGNHDDTSVMQRQFDAGPWDGPLSVQIGDWRLVLLNSALKGRIDGVVSQADIQSVRQWLDTAPDQPVLLALHHHPVAMDALWIDRYMLDHPEDLLSLVADFEQIRGVVWGHVHQAFDSRLAATSMLACPSTAVNSLPATARFEFDPAGPACRHLQLLPEGKIETGVLFVN